MFVESYKAPSRPPVTRAMSQHGAILLEVVVSLVVACAFLSIMLPAASQSYSRARTSQLRNEAIRLASTKLEELSAGVEKGALPKTKREEKLTWTIDRLSVESGDALSSAGKPSLYTYRISVLEAGESTPLLAFSVQRLHFD